jgi:hypothetical protein
MGFLTRKLTSPPPLSPLLCKYLLISGYNWSALTDTAAADSICSAAPCENGGRCLPLLSPPDGSACSCAPGYTGPTCAVPTTSCSQNPCLNGALCQDDPTTGKCSSVSVSSQAPRWVSSQSQGKGPLFYCYLTYFYWSVFGSGSATVV